MWIIVLTAWMVGFIHSLAPGHWLPVVLLVRARRWNDRTASLAALTAASGHILVSIGLGMSALLLGSRFQGENIHELEQKAGWVMVVFGMVYAIYSLIRHRKCHGHEHHGPDGRSSKSPFLFLFSLGLSPCFAVLPVFASALLLGSWTLISSMLGFAFGVSGALVMSSLAVSKGLIKLDTPLFEHYGDLLTGFAVAVMGVFLLVYPHTHAHV